MLGLINSLSSYITFVILILPFVLPRVPRLIAYTRSLSSSKLLRPLISSPSVLALLGSHSVYHVYRLFRPPLNIFTQTGLPLFSSSIRRIREELIRSTYPELMSDRTGLASKPTLPSHLQYVLGKLTSYDTRAIYARFGHDTLRGCTWCSPVEFTDWWAYRATSIGLDYLGEGIALAWLAGLIGRGRWRVVLGWAIGLGFVLEIATAGLKGIETTRGDGEQLSVKLETIRHIIFIILPFLLPLLSPPPAPPSQTSPLVALPRVAPQLEALLSHLKLIETSRLAVVRQPVLRSKLVHVGERLAEDAAWGSKDPNVREQGERVGLTAERGIRGGLREGAGAFLEGARNRIEK
ncbi:hypothetical protein [Phaffia rhodozyma]|uniref:Uncharacterized protein n=1 Tax=Phaffia rhodozyma TaxID=264483 RepID=A0A0F7SVD8_PHARH|nr:hypothetical protein [Phaffia rhodozyma]